MNLFEIYELTIGSEVYDEDFLPLKWAIASFPTEESAVHLAAMIGQLEYLVEICRLEKIL